MFILSGQQQPGIFKNYWYTKTDKSGPWPSGHAGTALPRSAISMFIEHKVWGCERAGQESLTDAVLSVNFYIKKNALFQFCLSDTTTVLLFFFISFGNRRGLKTCASSTFKSLIYSPSHWNLKSTINTSLKLLFPRPTHCNYKSNKTCSILIQHDFSECFLGTFNSLGLKFYLISTCHSTPFPPEFSNI